jgi:hypothetical protein
MKQLLSILSLLIGQHAFALVDVRLGVTTNSGSPSNVNEFIDAACGSCGVKSDKIAGYGGDIIVSPPLFDMGFGLRYETMSVAVEQAGLAKATFGFTRTALLLNYRLINTLIYLGPIVSYGLADTSKLTFEASGTTTELKSKSNTSYSVGVEGGMSLGLFALGAEVGYSSIKAKNYKTDNEGELSSGSVTLTEADYTGPYAKIHLGFKF